jgi:hypothetical protein
MQLPEDDVTGRAGPVPPRADLRLVHSGPGEQNDACRGLQRGIAYGIIPAALLWALIIWGIDRLVQLVR